MGRALRALLVWRHPGAWLACSIAFGVIGPLVCFGTVTRGRGLGIAIWPLDLYALIAVTTMTVWLLAAPGRRLDAVASGVFLAGALLAVPFAFVIGFFGFLLLGAALLHADSEAAFWGLLAVQPFLAFVVYAVNAARAFKHTREHGDGLALPFLGFVACAGMPFVLSLGLSTAAERTEALVLESERPLADLDLERWRYLAPGHDWPGLRSEYETTGSTDAEPLTPREHRLAEAFERLTGEALYVSID